MRARDLSIAWASECNGTRTRDNYTECA